MAQVVPYGSIQRTRVIPAVPTTAPALPQGVIDSMTEVGHTDAAYQHGTVASVDQDQAAFTPQDGHVNPDVPTHI